MGAPKPCLGYPSRTAAVVDLRQQGFLTGEIADQVGISEAAVAALECSARRGNSKPWQTAVFVPPNLLARLARHADARGITVNEIARRILEAVVGDQIVDAVLDDGAGASAP